MKVMMVYALMGANEQQLSAMLVGVGIVFLLVSAALAVWLHAGSKKHSVLGWFTRIVALVVGGVLGVSCSLVVDALPKGVRDALPDFATGAIILAFALLGSGLALRFVNLFGKREA